MDMRLPHPHKVLEKQRLPNLDRSRKMIVNYFMIVGNMLVILI